MAWPIIGLGVVAVSGMYAAAKSHFKVEEGHIALVFNDFSGFKDEEYYEGTHSIIPWIERPIIYNTRPQSNVFNCNIRDSTVKVGIRVVSHLGPDKICSIKSNYGDENDYKKFMHMLIDRYLIRDKALYSFSWLCSNKEELAKGIQKRLIENFEKDIVIDDVFIDSVSIGNEY